MTPQTLNYLLFGIGIGLLIQPAIQLARGDAEAAAPFFIAGLAVWIFALIRIRGYGGE
ncbi:MAG: hypothetical protein AAFQ36_02610 [Pseudomonadota bacterium]